VKSGENPVLLPMANLIGERDLIEEAVRTEGKVKIEGQAIITGCQTVRKKLWMKLLLSWNVI
jgi:hypothetical protein